MSKSNSPIDSENMPTSELSAQKSFWAQVGVWILSPQVAWLVLLLALLVTLLNWNNAEESLVQARQVQLESRASEVSDAILERIHGYEHVLRGSVGLFVASQNVDRSEWRDYISSLKIQEQHPGIQGVGISVPIPAARLDAHLRAIRAEGFPDYKVFPPGAREEYTPTIYIEPFGWRNRRAFGFDMYAETNRRKAMEHARDTNGTSMTSKVTLVQEVDEKMQAGILMFLPHYKHGMPHDTLAERRTNLVGYVSGSFRLNDLMNGIIKTKQAGAEKDVDIEIYDSTQRSADSLLYDDDSIAHALRTVPPGSLTLSRHIDLYGHTWTLYFTTLPAFDGFFDKSKPLLILLMGILLSVMLSGLIWMFATQRQRALALASHLTKENTERRRVQDEILLLNASLEQRVQNRTADLAVSKEHAERSSIELTSYIQAIGQHAIISAADLAGGIIQVNEKFCEISGYTQAELLGKDHRIVNSETHPKEFFAQLWATITRGDIWRGEICNRAKTGSLYWVDTAIVPIKDARGHVVRFISVRIDITERKRNEVLLVASNAQAQLLLSQLQQRNDENNMLIYSVSHDLRSPLVNLQGFSKELVAVSEDLRGLLTSDGVPAEIQKRGLGLIDSDMKESINFIQAGVKRLSNIIDAMLRLSRAGKVEYHWILVDTGLIVKRIVDSMQAVVVERGVAVTVGDLPQVWGDATVVDQIFANLIGNALNYLDPERRGLIEIGWQADAENNAFMHTYYVRDNGLGMSEAAKGKLFQIFQRFHPDKAKGEGVGLSIVRRMVERHSGKIWVKSSVGVGTTFFISLPIKAMETAE